MYVYHSAKLPIDRQTHEYLFFSQTSLFNAAEYALFYLKNSSFSGIDGRFDFFPTVGYFTKDTFQTISLSDKENLNIGRSTERTTSEKVINFSESVLKREV